MSENKSCGNCKSFIPSIDGFGACTEPSSIYGVHCNNDACSLFKMKSNNGWTEITPDNEEEVYDKPIAVAWKYDDRKHYRLIGDCCVPPEVMAKDGGFYYYVLPELKIE